MCGWVWIDTFFDTFCLVHLVHLVPSHSQLDGNLDGVEPSRTPRAALLRAARKAREQISSQWLDFQPGGELKRREPLGTLRTVEPVKLLEGHPVLAKKRYFDVHTDGWAEEQVHFQECAQNSHNFSDLPCLSLWVWQFLNTWILYLRTFCALNVNKETHLSRISIFAREVLSFRSWCNSTPKPLEKDSWQKTPLVTLMQPRKVQVLCSEDQCANLIWKSGVMCIYNL